VTEDGSGLFSAAREGIDAVIIDRSALGGQARVTERIRHLGMPGRSFRGGWCACRLDRAVGRRSRRGPLGPTRGSAVLQEHHHVSPHAGNA